MDKPDKWIEVSPDGVGWEVECYISGEGTVYQHSQTNKKQLPVVIRNFCCPNCGSKKFDPIYKSPNLLKVRLTGFEVIGPGPNAGLPRTDYKRIIGYVCPGCTIHFDDPVKFSKNKLAKIVPPVATPSSWEQQLIKTRELLLKGSHSSHRIRMEFFSEGHDWVCQLCGLTNTRKGWGKLARPCPASEEARQAHDQEANKEALAIKFGQV